MSGQLWRTVRTSISFCARKYVSGTYESQGLIAAAEFSTISRTDKSWVVTSESRLRTDLPGVTIQLVSTVAYRIVVVSLEGHRRVQTSQKAHTLDHIRRQRNCNLRTEESHGSVSRYRQ